MLNFIRELDILESDLFHVYLMEEDLYKSYAKAFKYTKEAIAVLLLHFS